MVQSKVALSWDCYESTICSGFSALQENGDFVDMTLAADGHFVKVHQVLIALASPYLKELLSSTPSQHPIIFLNNVSHSSLCFILQYVYTGEVLVPASVLSQFLAAAKALHIKGLESIASNEEIDKITTHSVTQVENETISYVDSLENLPEDRIHTQVHQLQMQNYLPTKSEKILSSNLLTMKQKATEQKQYYDVAGDTMDHDDFEDSQEIETVDKMTAEDNKSSSSSKLQFTVSIRGSMQVILNRYIYNVHSIQHRTGVRLWRCIDYKGKKKCRASVFTKGNDVLNRANLHNHSFHDQKILEKIKKNSVYTAIHDVEGCMENDKSDKKSIENVFISTCDSDGEMSDGEHKKKINKTNSSK